MADPRPGSPHSSLVVVVEDDDEMRLLMARVLRRDGHDVVAAVDGAAVLVALEDARLRGREPDVLVSDVRMPGMTGLELVAWLRRERFAARAVLVSAFPDDATREAARALGVRYVLEKPFDLDELRAVVRGLIA